MGYDASEKPLLGCRILVVEDNFLIAAGIVETIEGAGGRVVGPYASMVDALEHLDDLGATDGAVLDIGLNQQDSYPLADALQLTRIPFVFLTGVPKDRLPERFARVAHISKPFLNENLVQTLQKLATRRKTNRIS